MSTFIELFNEDEERLRAALTDARSRIKRVSVVEEELDRLLLRYNDLCEDETIRQCAAFGISGARMSVALMAAGAEDKPAYLPEAYAGEESAHLSEAYAGKESAYLPEAYAGEESAYLPDVSAEESPAFRKDANSTSRMLVKAFLLCIGCLLGAGAILVPAATSPALKEVLNLHVVIGMMAAGLVLIIAAFLIPVSKKKPDRKNPTDPAAAKAKAAAEVDRICSVLRSCMLLLDRELADAYTAQQEKEALPVNEAGTADEQEAAMFAGLLEAAYSKDGEYALDKLDDVKYYLHRKGVRVVDYSEENRAMFDLMPAQHNETIRPALVSDTKVLSRGLAGSSQQGAQDMDR